LRDAEKTVKVDTSTKDMKAENLGSSFKASSGLAFVELSTHEAAPTIGNGKERGC